MFISNGKICAELKTFQIVPYYKKEVSDKLKEIDKRIMRNSFYYGSSGKAEEVSDIEQEKYLTNYRMQGKDEHEYHLCINDGNIICLYMIISKMQKKYFILSAMLSRIKRCLLI